MDLTAPPDDLRDAPRPPFARRGDGGVVWLLRPRPAGRLFEEVEEQASSRMLRHGLAGWAFGFGRGKRTLGTTRVRAGAATGTIRLSRHLILSGSADRVRETLLHEIAHAVAFARHGRRALNHGPLWREVAREVGAAPAATCKGPPVAPPTHVLVCRRCGSRVGLYRRPKHPAGAYRHRGCGGTFALDAQAGGP